MPALTPTWGREVEVDRSGPFAMRVYRERRHRVSDMLTDARRFATREHVVQDERRITFAQHEAAILRVAARLRDHGLRTGDPVLLLAWNSIEWVVAYWAILRAGGVVVLGNPWWSASEAGEILDRVVPVIALVDSDSQARTAGLPRTITLDQLRPLIADDTDPPDVAQPPVGEHDPAVVMFSAGTTGAPKGVTLPHRAVLVNVHNVLNITRSLPHELDGEQPQNVALHTLPLFHAGGLQTLGVNLMAGTRMVFLPGRFDPAVALEIIEQERITHWAGVPTMLTRMMDHPDFPARDTSSVRSIVLAGASVPETLRDRVAMTFAAVKSGGGINYGLTEAGGTVCSASAAQAREHPGTVGRPVPVAEIRVEPDRELGTVDGAGEILVRSPGLMLGYWGECGSPVVDGWLHTGDLGRLDSGNWLYLTGRKKDIIIRGGENISSGQVEERLRQHPDVLDVAVVGLPDEDLGEEVAAAIVPRPGADIELEELTRFVAAGVARFAVPTRWWVRSEPLPTSAVGKVLKRVVLEEFPT